jgi:hypothetical protein
MFRRVCLLLATAAAIAAATSDAAACGDKFLRVGRSARFRRYASVHPAAILLYAPKWTGAGISEFEAMLRRAGHTPFTVTTDRALANALTSTKYDVVITGFGYAAAAREALMTSGSTAALLPVVYQATRSEDARASATFPILLRPERMTRFEALEEIDRLLDLSLKANGVPSRTH